VRGFTFDNPNAVLSEFVDLIARSREICERQFAPENVSEGKCGVVLLTRNTLRIPQISSPVMLPDWFPRFGGQTTSVILEDVTWSGDATLDCDEASIPDISRRLFDLDGALLARLSATHRQSTDFTDALWSHLCGGENYLLSKFFVDAAESRRKVHNANNFRPSTAGAQFLVARVWRTVQRNHAERIGKLGDALATALQLPDPLERSWHQTMVSILARPANPPKTEAAAFASSMLVSVAASAQYITAAAHADAYGSYPVPLLRSLSYDFRTGLASATSILTTLDAKAEIS
jgi:hypothetical protein